MTIGFGIVGCGMISNFHAKAIADVKGAKLVACFDTRDEVGREVRGGERLHRRTPISRRCWPTPRSIS